MKISNIDKILATMIKEKKRLKSLRSGIKVGGLLLNLHKSKRTLWKLRWNRKFSKTTQTDSDPIYNSWRDWIRNFKNVKQVKNLFEEVGMEKVWLYLSNYQDHSSGEWEEVSLVGKIHFKLKGRKNIKRAWECINLWIFLWMA